MALPCIVADVAEVHGRMLSRHVLALQATAAGHAAAQHLGLRPPAGRRRQPPAPPPTRQRLQPAPPLSTLACDDPLELCGGCPQARSEHDAIIAAIGRVEGCCTEHCFADRCSFRLTTHSARVLEAAAGPTMHLQPAPPRPPVAAAAKRGVVASSSAIQGGRAAPLRRQRRAAGGQPPNSTARRAPVGRRPLPGSTQPNCGCAALIRGAAGPRPAAAGAAVTGAACRLPPLAPTLSLPPPVGCRAAGREVRPGAEQRLPGLRQPLWLPAGWCVGVLVGRAEPALPCA